MATTGGSHSSSDAWFSAFYPLVSQTVWLVSAPERARRHHGGARCHTRPPRLGLALALAGTGGECQACSSDHVQTVYAIGLNWQKASAGDKVVDAVTFARCQARDRWRDTVAKADGAEYGWLQKPKRTVFESRWIDRALAGNQYDKHLLYLVVRSVQGHDAPEGGMLYPYNRFAQRLLSTMGRAVTPAQVAVDLARVLDRLRQANPAWVERHIDTKSQQLARVCGLDRRRDVGTPPSPVGGDTAWADDDGPLVDWAARALAAARGARDAEEVLFRAIADFAGSAAADRAKADGPAWRWLVSHVTRHGADRAIAAA